MTGLPDLPTPNVEPLDLAVSLTPEEYARLLAIESEVLWLVADWKRLKPIDRNIVRLDKLINKEEG